MWSVYLLLCPVTREPRYVGIGLNPQARLKAHCSKNAAVLVRQWVAGLGGRLPVLEIESTHEERNAALERERDLIRELVVAGRRLLNVEGHPNRAGIHARWREAGPRKIPEFRIEEFVAPSHRRARHH